MYAAVRGARRDSSEGLASTREFTRVLSTHPVAAACCAEPTTRADHLEEDARAGSSTRRAHRTACDLSFSSSATVSLRDVSSSLSAITCFSASSSAKRQVRLGTVSAPDQRGTAGRKMHRTSTVLGAAAFLGTAEAGRLEPGATRTAPVLTAAALVAGLLLESFSFKGTPPLPPRRSRELYSCPP